MKVADSIVANTMPTSPKHVVSLIQKAVKPTHHRWRTNQANQLTNLLKSKPNSPLNITMKEFNETFIQPRTLKSELKTEPE